MFCVVLSLVLSGDNVSFAGSGDIEQRIADFWKRIDAMQPGDYLSSADIGQWALNVIERDSRARITVAEFRTATAQMQQYMDRAGPAPAAAPIVPLLIAPATASLAVGDRLQFSVSGAPLGSAVSWSVTGGCGAVTNTGLFVATATSATQPCSVVVSAGGLTAAAVVLVTSAAQTTPPVASATVQVLTTSTEPFGSIAVKWTSPNYGDGQYIAFVPVGTNTPIGANGYAYWYWNAAGPSGQFLFTLPGFPVGDYQIRLYDRFGNVVASGNVMSIHR